MQSIIVIYIKSANISFNNYFLLMNIIWSREYLNHRLFSINNDFRSHIRKRRLFSLVTQHLIYILFKDKGRLHAHHSGIRIDHCRNNFYQVSLSEIIPSRDCTRPRHGWPGLFNCWTWSQLPSSVNSTACPKEWSTLTQQNGVVHTSSIRDKFISKDVSFETAPQHFIWDGSATFHLGRLRNISFGMAPQHFIWDSSATFHIYQMHRIRTEMVIVIRHIIMGCFLNSIRYIAYISTDIK